MKKEDIDVLAKLLSNMKDALKDLEYSIKKQDWTKVGSAKSRISDLQIQINQII